jgi:1-deoxy-D-xylulose-5-phosphate synthase
MQNMMRGEHLSILEQINNSADLKNLTLPELKQLCAEIRSFLIENVSKSGGHLASNLGVVELTVALHRILDVETDRLIFDVGHQCYVHKMLTGRLGGFSSLRSFGGISGFPKPSESSSDAFIADMLKIHISRAEWKSKARSKQKYKLACLSATER